MILSLRTLALLGIASFLTGVVDRLEHAQPQGSLHAIDQNFWRD